MTGQVARAAGHVAVAELIENWSFRACPLLFMPFDALVHVMAFLEPHDLCSVAQTCSVHHRGPRARFASTLSFFLG